MDGATEFDGQDVPGGGVPDEPVDARPASETGAPEEHDDVISGEPMPDTGAPEEPDEVVDGIPVLAEVRDVTPAPPAAVPAMQAAALTAGGFFAGALAMALVKRIAARKLGEVAPVQRPLGTWPPATGTSRTYLVNVRLITRPDE